MKQIIYMLYFSLLVTVSCKKNNTDTFIQNPYNEIFLAKVTIDNQTLEKVYAKDSTNIPGGYTWDQGDGNYYFGSSSTYEFGNHQMLEIELGAAYGPVGRNRDSAFASFIQLCAVGQETYDAIRYAGQKLNNRVEITYVDQHQDFWSSTKLDLSDSLHPKPAPNPIEQTGRTFIITSSKIIYGENGKPTVIIVKGTFNCMLYKYDGSAKKQLTQGSFTAVCGVI